MLEAKHENTAKIARLSAEILRSLPTNKARQHRPSFQSVDLKLEAAEREETCHAIVTLVFRPWFKNAWMIQEFVFGGRSAGATTDSKLLRYARTTTLAIRHGCEVLIPVSNMNPRSYLKVLKILVLGWYAVWRKPIGRGSPTFRVGTDLRDLTTEFFFGGDPHFGMIDSVWLRREESHGKRSMAF